jgi:two-component system, NarL family, sensor histidine kinase UhpB
MIFRQFPLIIKACHSWTKKFLLIILFAAFCQLSFAQERKREIDSLMNILETAAKDTNKVKILNNLSRIFVETKQYTASRKYADEAMVLAEKLNYKRGIAFAYYNIGLNYEYQGNNAEAIKNFLIELKIWEELGDKDPVAYINVYLGEIYYVTNKYPEARKRFLTALKISQENGNKWRETLCYNYLGLISVNEGNYAEALKNYLAALKISEERKDTLWIVVFFNNIAEIYRNQGNYPEALKYLLAASKITEVTGHNYALVRTTIAEVYRNQGNYSEALKNLLAALKFAEEDKHPYGIALAKTGIGIIYKIQGNYVEALKNHLEALMFWEERGEKSAIGDSYNNIGHVYISLNKYPEAKQYLMKGLSISKEIGHKENIKMTYKLLSELDSAMGNYRQALVNYKLSTDYKDSLLNETNSKQIAGMKEQYESEKKDKEILLLTSDKQKLETEKQISALESERMQTLNLYSQQQIILLGNEKQIHQLQIDRNKADYAVKKADADKKQEQLVLLNKEKTIQSLELKKQTQAKNFFIAGMALFAVLSFFVYRNYRTRQKLKLQTLRNKIARDLHDDVGSTLSSISIFSQMAQEQSKETLPLLETIGESSRKMLDAMADIVWTINPENDQFEKIILRMRSFAYELLGAKKIDFEFVADEDVAKMKLPMDVRKNLYLIFKEATNNMVKYSKANRAFFAVKREGNDLTLLIRDNGNGFDINQPKQGNGLINMRKRAGEMGAVISIDSLPGEGTTIQLKVAV